MDSPHHKPSRPDPYQHWMDDAANMGLILYRMRQDSKREQRMPSSSPPPTPPNPPATPKSSPIPIRPTPVLASPTPHNHARSAQSPTPLSPPFPYPVDTTPLYHHHNTTPRTDAALQIPTVATHSTSTTTPTPPPPKGPRLPPVDRPHPLYLQLD